MRGIDGGGIEYSGDGNCEVARIDGVAVRRKFTILYAGWECDSEGWMTEDGRLWGTDHGRLVRLTQSDILDLMSDYTGVMNNMLSVAQESQDLLEKGAPDGDGDV